MQVAIKYELLLRQVYQCGKDFSKGADAAICRAMEQAHTNLKTKVMYVTQIERKYEFKKRIATLRNYISKTITDGIKQINHLASAEVIRELETEQILLTVSFYEKEKLDEIIEKVSKLFHANGLVIWSGRYLTSTPNDSWESLGFVPPVEFI